MKNLLIVESPAKAKTIGKYLGNDYIVLASMGHIRDLPSKIGSVDIEKDFKLKYQISPKSNKNISNLVKAAGNVNKLILASDPDREGEAIAWHVVEVLYKKKAINKKISIERIVFNAITKEEINKALNSPREIDMNLVNSQQARRALDYLVGFNLSPILWKKLPGSKSAGRVQSVVLLMICDREDEISNFKKREYWNIEVQFNLAKDSVISSNLTHVNEKKIEKFSIKDRREAEDIERQLKNKNYFISDISTKFVKRKPNPPFITSTLQQEASYKLGFSSKKTMMIAQKLYEGIEIDGNVKGLITYMRTDGVYVVNSAIKEVRKLIKNNYGESYCPKIQINYKSKAKNSQEAHEAIRPTDFSLPPNKANKFLDKDQLKLYNIIWNRMISSQMNDSITEQVSISIITDPRYAKLKTVISILKFDGFKILSDIKEKKDTIIPKVSINEKLEKSKINLIQSFTEPPPRFNEASLIKNMEDLGIGRPSTYAAIISILQERGYVKLDKKRFFPEERGRVVTEFLKEFFPKYVAYDYTALLEEELDVISDGKLDWKIFLAKFWKNFDQDLEKVSKYQIKDILNKLNDKISNIFLKKDEDGSIDDKCQLCETGKIKANIGKYGVYFGCSNYPDCKNIKSISNLNNKDSSKNYEPKLLGNALNGEIFLKKGPYGFYLELSKKNDKPKRISIAKNENPESLSLEKAISLLSLPKELGVNPETDLKVIVSIGPFGPYILYNKKYISVKDVDILEITIDEALKRISKAKK